MCVRLLVEMMNQLVGPALPYWNFRTLDRFAAVLACLKHRDVVCIRASSPYNNIFSKLNYFHPTLNSAKLGASLVVP
jgi:hypothetical protein